MNTQKKRKSLRPWQGIVFFLVIMAAFFAVCVPMQMAWGIYGLALTELLILALALLFALIARRPPGEIFPVHRVHLLPVLGTVIIWVSALLATMVITLVQYRLFPAAMSQVSGSLESVIGSVPAALGVVIVCLMPAICEEAVHRGVILSCMRPLKKTWLIVLVMGILFGLFHTDPLRFLPTAILGAAMTYVVVKTGNMVYSAIFHGINNLVPLLAQHAMASRQDPQLTEVYESLGSAVIPVASIGMYLAMAAVVPFGLYLGRDLLLRTPGTSRRFWPRGQETRTAMKILIPSLVIFGAGVILTAAGIFLFPDYSDLVRQARLSP